MRCTYLAENINKCVERKAVRGGCRSLSRLICEIVNLVGQGNYIFLSKKLGNFRNLWLWQPGVEEYVRNTKEG